MSDFYSRHFLEYHRKTFFIRPDHLRPFVERLHPGERVLDVACGSGRDLIYLKSRGFAVIGFEKSPGLASLARFHAECEVIEGDFDIFPFETIRVGAILLSAALVHVRPDRFPDILSGILQALDPDHPISGTVYLSLKEGTGAVSDETGRIFYLWQENPLRSILKQSGMSILHFSRTPSALSSPDIWLGFVVRPYRLDDVSRVKP